MKTALSFLFLLCATTANAGSVSFTVVQGGFPNLTKTYSLTDAEIARLIAANQVAANIAVNGNASRAQVLQYIVSQWMQDGVNSVKTFETPVAPPPPAPINPQ